MQIDHSRLITPKIIGKLSTILKSGFTEYANVRIDSSVTNSNYLVIPFGNKSDLAILVEISKERLEIIKGGEMNLIYPFQHPEKGFFYLAQFDDEGNIIYLNFLTGKEEGFEWPIPANLSVNMKWVETILPFDIVDYAVKRGRFALEITVEFENFKDSNIKLSAIKRYLVSFHDMIKTAILSNSLNYNEKNIETKLNMGFSKIEFKCLHGVLEFDYNKSPQLPNLELESLTNLYFLLAAESEEEIYKYFELFPDKKLIAQYISLLRKIVEDKSYFKSKMATPEKHTNSFEIDRNRSRSLQKKVISRSECVSYNQTVTGILTRIDYDSSARHPLFSIHSSTDDQTYSGKISKAADAKLHEESASILTHNYECKLSVTFFPATSTKDEKYDYELVDFTKLEKVEQPKIPRDKEPPFDDLPW